MFESRIFLFKEIINQDQTWFQHYKLAEDNLDIIPGDVLSEEAHWELLACE